MSFLFQIKVERSPKINDSINTANPKMTNLFPLCILSFNNFPSFSFPASSFSDVCISNFASLRRKNLSRTGKETLERRNPIDPPKIRKMALSTINTTRKEMKKSLPARYKSNDTAREARFRSRTSLRNNFKVGSSKSKRTPVI